MIFCDCDQRIELHREYWFLQRVNRIPSHQFKHFDRYQITSILEGRCDVSVINHANKKAIKISEGKKETNRIIKSKDKYTSASSICLYSQNNCIIYDMQSLTSPWSSSSLIFCVFYLYYVAICHSSNLQKNPCMITAKLASQTQ